MFKKLLFTAAFCFGVATIASAQLTIKGLVGMNFSNLSESPDGTEVTGTAGYQFGGGLMIGNKFYLEPNIQWVRNNRDFTIKDGEDTNFEVNESWLKIPIYAGYHLLGEREDEFALRVFAGPSVAFLTNVDGGDSGLSKSDLNDSRWAIDGGVGIDVLFLFAELNYEYGLNDHGKEEGFDAKHGAFIFNVGVHFDM